MAQSLKCNLKNLAIHRDARGWLVEVLKQSEIDQKIEQIYVASLCPGAIRGNHWHLKRIEWFFVIGDNVQVHLQDAKTKETKVIDIRPDNPLRISIFPPIAHAVVNKGENVAYLISAQNNIYDPGDSDTFEYKIL
ncbi:MAG TPA: WxcM-like domain-containing protein [Candidatus Pacearchaeota archaeon]|jgi:UDP-2-acetamido-2,6-beta-L-arabino-hexul-4-ose reductase|nr:WxcM-like domain-containing protein [Candidatus Pacearchaeota archaeon]